MENNNIIVIATRTSIQKSRKSNFEFLGFSALVFASDLIWFLIRKNKYGTSTWWDITFLVISSILLGFALLGLLFSAGNKGFDKKVSNTPLIAFDTEKNKFIVQSYYDQKELLINPNDMVSVSISDSSDEVTLSYKENGKDKTTLIGYTNKYMETEINNKINEYKIS